MDSRRFKLERTGTSRVSGEVDLMHFLSRMSASDRVNQGECTKSQRWQWRNFTVESILSEGRRPNTVWYSSLPLMCVQNAAWMCLKHTQTDGEFRQVMFHLGQRQNEELWWIHKQTSGVVKTLQDEEVLRSKSLKATITEPKILFDLLCVFTFDPCPQRLCL